MTTSFHELPPRGRYVASEVGRLAGVSGQKIGQWARNGYINGKSSKSGRFPLVYGFQDIAEAIIVHELLDRGASYRDIRQATAELRNRFGYNWPLSHAELSTTHGGEIIAAADRVLYDIGRRGWQQVTDHDLVKVVGLLEHGGWAARELRDLQHIKVNPRILSGRPAVRGTRMPVEKVAHLARTDQGRHTLRSDYELSDEEIRDAQRWWEATEAYEQAA
jgi:uncharacterized protein (DUF433 family)